MRRITQRYLRVLTVLPRTRAFCSPARRYRSLGTAPTSNFTPQLDDGRREETPEDSSSIRVDPQQ